jgi:anti-anti-sigma factor
MASAGIALLIRALKLLKDRGDTLKIAGMRQSLRDILRTTNLIDLFEEFEPA